MRSRKPAPRHHAGQVLTWDFQADIFAGQYQLVERTGPSQWVAVHLPPSEAEIQSIREDPLFGGDSPESAEEEIRRRFDRAGQPFPIRFVSAREYAEYF